MKKSPELHKPNNIDIECLGGDGGVVTGSCHRINSSVLVDYGMFQGRFDERSSKGVRRNFTTPADIAKGLTDIILTHPHIDHTGLGPRVFQKGFTPKVVVTEATATFMEPMLYNSAQIQENQGPENRLYDRFDVDKMLRCLRVVEPFKEVPIGQKHSRMTAMFLPNGHVMGANSIIVEALGARSRKKRMLFTGDMGKPNQSLCGGYLDQAGRYPSDLIDVLVVESTNFNRLPVSFEEKRANLLGAIQEAWKNGGNPLLPTLSFHRLQEIMEMLHNSQKEGLIPDDCKIFIDAPLGMLLTECFKKLDPEQLSHGYGDDPDYYKTNEESMARFGLNNVTVIDEHNDSIRNDAAMAEYRGKAIILASGGMGEHGRALNYLHGSFGKNPKNAIVFTCHQVEGTEGAKMVRVKNILTGNKRGASIVKISGFTSHISGEDETFAFLNRFNLEGLQSVIVTHGNNLARTAMAEAFTRRCGANVYLPNLYETVVV